MKLKFLMLASLTMHRKVFAYINLIVDLLYDELNLLLKFKYFVQTELLIPEEKRRCWRSCVALRKSKLKELAGISILVNTQPPKKVGDGKAVKFLQVPSRDVMNIWIKYSNTFQFL